MGGCGCGCDQMGGCDWVGGSGCDWMGGCGGVGIANVVGWVAPCLQEILKQLEI